MIFNINLVRVYAPQVSPVFEYFFCELEFPVEFALDLAVGVLTQ